MSGGEFSHLTGPYQHDGVAFQGVEYLLAQFDGHIADRNGICRDSGLRSNPFGNAERVVH